MATPIEKAHDVASNKKLDTFTGAELKEMKDKKRELADSLKAEREVTHEHLEHLKTRVEASKAALADPEKAHADEVNAEIEEVKKWKNSPTDFAKDALTADDIKETDTNKNFLDKAGDSLSSPMLMSAIEQLAQLTHSVGSKIWEMVGYKDAGEHFGYLNTLYSSVIAPKQAPSIIKNFFKDKRIAMELVPGSGDGDAGSKLAEEWGKVRAKSKISFTQFVQNRMKDFEKEQKAVLDRTDPNKPIKVTLADIVAGMPVVPAPAPAAAPAIPTGPAEPVMKNVAANTELVNGSSIAFQLDGTPRRVAFTKNAITIDGNRTFSLKAIGVEIEIPLSGGKKVKLDVPLSIDSAQKNAQGKLLLKASAAGQGGEVEADEAKLTQILRTLLPLGTYEDKTSAGQIIRISS